MNYVITGSLGHISKPLTQKLVAAGHAVTVVTSKAERIADIEALGAKGIAGSIEDAAFVEKALAGADAVYLMIPPKFNVAGDWIDYQKQVADNYVAAVKANGIKNVAVLSSVGADLRKGCGPVDGAGYLESKVLELEGVNSVFLRPSYFYYNLLAQIDMVKHMGILGSNFGSEGTLVLTDTTDIANVAAEELLNIQAGNKVVYISSDERPFTEIASVLGNAIGKPGLNWVEFTDEQAAGGMEQAGLSDTIVEGFVTMGKALRDGLMQADYKAKNPAKNGTVKLEDFAKTFAAVYNA